MTARGRVGAALAWALWSSGLLVVGFLLVIYLASLLAARRLPADEIGGVQRALVMYAQVVLVKGLLPQLLLTLAFYSLLDPWLRLGARGHAAVVLALAVAATLAVAIVFPLLLTTPAVDLPAVRIASWPDTLRTCAEMTAAVVAAASAPLLLRRLRAARSPLPAASPSH